MWEKKGNGKSCWFFELRSLVAAAGVELKALQKTFLSEGYLSEENNCRHFIRWMLIHFFSSLSTTHTYTFELLKNKLGKFWLSSLRRKDYEVELNFLRHAIDIKLTHLNLYHNCRFYRVQAPSTHVWAMFSPFFSSSSLSFTSSNLVKSISRPSNSTQHS